jgi:WD40 repeat protein
MPHTNTLYIADKSGDVYSIPVSAPAVGEPCIGTVSMITDMVCWQDKVLFGDRDEKVRLCQSEMPYEMERFYMGHKETVTAVHIPVMDKNLVVTGGHDAFVLVWDVASGTLLQMVKRDELEGGLVHVSSSTDWLLLAILNRTKVQVMTFDSTTRRFGEQPIFVETGLQIKDAVLDTTERIWVIGVDGQNKSAVHVYAHNGSKVSKSGVTNGCSLCKWRRPRLSVTLRVDAAWTCCVL